MPIQIKANHLRFTNDELRTREATDGHGLITAKVRMGKTPDGGNSTVSHINQGYAKPKQAQEQAHPVRPSKGNPVLYQIVDVHLFPADGGGALVCQPGKLGPSLNHSPPPARPSGRPLLAQGHRWRSWRLMCPRQIHTVFDKIG